MEEFARLTFPNGRTGGPYVDGHLVIIHAITANWGKQGPARDRFYAFDKNNGDLVWASTPGITPKDSSFAPLVFENLPSGRRVFYSGTGCGHVVCIDARTGQALWRFQMSYGGVNAGVVIHDDSIIAVHGKENIDSTIIGRMVAIKKPLNLPALGEDILLLGKEHEIWRNNGIEAFTSSPVYREEESIQPSSVANWFALMPILVRNIGFSSLLLTKFTLHPPGQMVNYMSLCLTERFLLLKIRAKKEKF